MMPFIHGLDLNPNVNSWYASLTGPFLGYYVEIIGATSEMEAREWCASNLQMKLNWCSIYTFDRVSESIGQFGGAILRIREL